MRLDQHIASVVITTKNEERNIRFCLEGIACQSWPYREVIVVDNSSSDCTVEIARTFTNKVFDKGPERSAQRNYGMPGFFIARLLYRSADSMSPCLPGEAERAWMWIS